MPGKKDDRALVATIKAAQAGDERAFEVLLNIVQEPVMRLALSILRQREDAEDAAQETLIKLWRTLPDFRFECPILTYVLGMARTVSLDILRRRGRQGRLETPMTTLDGEGEAHTLDPPDTDPDNDPVASYERRERIEAVRAAMERLSPEHREVLLLRNIRGLDHAQIAYMLGISEGTVKSRLSRARENLKKILKNFSETGNFF